MSNTTTIEASQDSAVSNVDNSAEAKALFATKFSESKSALVSFVGRHISDVGEQNLESGRMALELCLMERDFFGGKYSRDYYTKTLGRVEDEILIFTNVEPKDIRLDYRIRCYMLRELLKAVPNVGAELAVKFTFWELKDVVNRALDFKVDSLSYALVSEWEPFFNDIADRRRRGEHVTSGEFKALYNKRCEFLAEKAKESGKQSQKELENEVRKHNNKLAKKRQDVSNAILDAFTENAMSPADVVDSLRDIAKKCNVTVDARTVGYSPKNFTRSDCRPFVTRILKSGPDGLSVLEGLFLEAIKVLVHEDRIGDAYKILNSAQERYNRAVSDEANPKSSGPESGPVVKKIKPKPAEEQLRPTGS